MNGMQMQAGGNGVLGWIVIVGGTIVTIFTIIISIYWAIRPGESNEDHPKRSILRDDR